MNELLLIWVLVVVPLGHQDGPVAFQEFQTKSQCEEAAKFVNSTAERERYKRQYFSAKCFPSGEKVAA